MSSGDLSKLSAMVAGWRIGLASLMLVALSQVLIPVVVLAQAPGVGRLPTDAGVARSETAAAGTMIGATMETLGYHAQERVLSQMSQHLNALGALIFLGVVLSALLTAAMLGSYRPALWLLVGPPVFFFASGIKLSDYSNQIQASGAEWRFGVFVDEANTKERFVELDGTPAAVSYLFHKYNVLISEVSQKLIEVFTQRDMTKEMIFMARQRALEELFGAKLNDAGVMAMAAHFLVHCAVEVGDARLIALGNGIDPEFKETVSWNAAKERYCSRYALDKKPFPAGPAMEFVYTLPDKYSAGFTISKAEHLTTHRMVQQTLTCAQMWEIVLAGGEIEAKRAFDQVASRVIPEHAYRLFGTQVWVRVIDAVKEKLTNAKDAPQERLAPGGDPCPANSEADIGLQASSFEVVQRMVAAMMLREVFRSTPNQEMFRQIQSDASGIIPQEGAASTSTGDPAMRREQMHRQRASQFAEARKYEAYALINLLPYIQGFLLYALALTYPFFTLLLLIPGQAGGFLNWMALWAWAKCWDVGWALVMVVDNIAWELLPKTTYFNLSRPNALGSPIDLMEGAYAGDPAYSVATYWMLLASMMLAVPMVSAHAILGAKSAIAGRLLGTDGVHEIAQRYAGTAEDMIGGALTAKNSQLASQARVRAVMQRGEAQAAKFNADLAKTSNIGKGLSLESFLGGGQPWAKLGHVIAPVMSAFGGSAESKDAPSVYQKKDGAGEAEGSEKAEGSSLGNGIQEAANEFLRPGGTADQNVQDNQVQANMWGESRVFSHASKLLPQLRQRLYGNIGAGEVDAASDAAMRAEFFQRLGIDVNNKDDSIFVETEGEQLFESYKNALYSKALGDLHHVDADIMALLASGQVGFWGRIGGPVFGYSAARGGYDSVMRQKGVGYDWSAKEYGRVAGIKDAIVNLSNYEASYDPGFTHFDSLRAYNSVSQGGGNGRGGEFFRYAQYDASWVFNLSQQEVQRAYDRGEQSGRAAGNWLIFPFMGGGD